MKDTIYSVTLERLHTGSAVTIEVTACSTAQAMRKAQVELPGWKAASACLSSAYHRAA